MYIYPNTNTNSKPSFSSRPHPYPFAYTTTPFGTKADNQKKGKRKKENGKKTAVFILENTRKYKAQAKILNKFLFFLHLHYERTSDFKGDSSGRIDAGVMVHILFFYNAKRIKSKKKLK